MRVLVWSEVLTLKNAVYHVLLGWFCLLANSILYFLVFFLRGFICYLHTYIYWWFFMNLLPNWSIWHLWIDLFQIWGGRGGWKVKKISRMFYLNMQIVSSLRLRLLTILKLLCLLISKCILSFMYIRIYKYWLFNSN